MDLLKLNKKIRLIWVIRNLFLSVIIMLCVIPAFFSNNTLVIVGVLIPCLICVLLIMIWPFLRYKLYSFCYDDKRIAINYGVIFRHRVIIPVCQIQDLHTYNGPIMSLFKLSGIIISTAGSNFNIAGMLSDDAIKMVYELESLLNKRLNGDSYEEV